MEIAILILGDLGTLEVEQADADVQVIQGHDRALAGVLLGLTVDVDGRRGPQTCVSVLGIGGIGVGHEVRGREVAALPRLEHGGRGPVVAGVDQRDARGLGPYAAQGDVTGVGDDIGEVQGIAHDDRLIARYARTVSLGGVEIARYLVGLVRKHVLVHARAKGGLAGGLDRGVEADGHGRAVRRLDDELVGKGEASRCAHGQVEVGGKVRDLEALVAFALARGLEAIQASGRRSPLAGLRTGRNEEGDAREGDVARVGDGHRIGDGAAIDVKGGAHAHRMLRVGLLVGGGIVRVGRVEVTVPLALGGIGGVSGGAGCVLGRPSGLGTIVVISTGVAVRRRSGEISFFGKLVLRFLDFAHFVRFARNDSSRHGLICIRSVRRRRHAHVIEREAEHQQTADDLLQAIPMLDACVHPCRYSPEYPLVRHG